MASTEARLNFLENLGSLVSPPIELFDAISSHPCLSDFARLPHSFHASRMFLLPFDVIWEARSGLVWPPPTTAPSYEPTTMSFSTAMTVPSCMPPSHWHLPNISDAIACEPSSTQFRPQ